jgi:hypothetical protein
MNPSKAPMIKNASAVLAAVLVLNQRKHAAESAEFPSDAPPAATPPPPPPSAEDPMAELDRMEAAAKAKRMTPAERQRAAAEAQQKAELAKRKAEDDRLLEQTRVEVATQEQRQRELAQRSEAEAAQRATRMSTQYPEWKKQIENHKALRARGLASMTDAQAAGIQKMIDADDLRVSEDIAKAATKASPVAPAPGAPGSPEHRQVQSGRATYHLAQRMRLPQRAAQAGNAVARAVTPWFQSKQPATGVSSNVPLKAPASAAAPAQGITSIKKPGQTGAGQT